MPAIDLTLQMSQPSEAEITAWFIPGGNADQWVQEIARWPVDHLSVQVIGIRCDQEIKAAGVLAIPPTTQFSPSGNCLAYKTVGSNVYLPVNADLYPQVLRSEFDETFASHYLHVWVPGRGLTAVELDQIGGLCDLLIPPPQSTTTWHKAVPGTVFTNRIVAILPDQTESAEDIIADGKGDIGEKAKDIARIPDPSDRPGSAMSSAIKNAAMMGTALPILGIAKLVSAIGQLIPKGNSGSTGTSSSGWGGHSGAGQSYSKSGSGSLVEYAKKLMQKISKSLEEMRHKEINRLLKMLEKDPDQGLKFALPMAGDSYRGLSTPGSTLGARDTNFSLGRLGGGQAGDIWNLPWDYRQRLLAKYRELATRETRLGRFRRAAYIYAELLGDFQSAASVLKEGTHFREAAILYRERLNNLEAAAECLEQGELWHEAIEAYRELNQFEKVGDLLSHIEHKSEAAEAYLLAAEKFIEQRNLIEAARIHDQKLEDTDRAIQILDSGWPFSEQEEECVRQGFKIRGRIGDHPSADSRLDELVLDAERLERQTDVAELLAHVFDKYPDARICDRAKSLCRQIIAYQMQNESRTGVNRLVRVLGRLAPNDRLLARDGRRYADEQFSLGSSGTPPNRYEAPQTPEKLKLLEQHELDPDVTWSGATSINEWFFIAGVKNNRVVLAQCGYRTPKTKERTAWKDSVVGSETKIKIFGNRSPLKLFAIGESPLPTKSIFLIDSSNLSMSAGTPKGHSKVWGAAPGTLDQTWTIENRDDPVLACIHPSGHIASSVSLLNSNDADWGAVEIPIPMHATRNDVIIGIGRDLFRIKNNQMERMASFASRILSITGRPPYAARHLIVSLEMGAALLQLDLEHHVYPIATDMEAPTTLINSGNFLIAADETRIEVYQNDGKPSRKTTKLRNEAEHQTGRPIALLSMPQTDHFAMVTAQGVVSIYSV